MERTSAGVLVQRDAPLRKRAGKGRGGFRSAKRRAKWVRAAVTPLVLLLSAALSLVYGEALFDLAHDGLAGPMVVAEPAMARASAALPRVTAAPSEITTQAPKAIAAAPKTAGTSPPAITDAAPLSVWVSSSGTRYHATPTCSGMQNARALTAEEAVTRGYLPCQRCKPPGGESPAKAEKAAAPTAISASSAAIIWLPSSGARYHATPGCSGMQNARASTVGEAIAQGYLPCQRCNPPTQNK